MPASTSKSPAPRQKWRTRFIPRISRSVPPAQELLSAHRVPSAGNRHGSHFRAHSLDGPNNVVECVRLNLSRYASKIQSGMDVVELSRMGFCANHAFLCFHARIVIAPRIYYNTIQKTYHFPIPMANMGDPMAIGIKNTMSMRIVNGLKLAMKARRVTYGELGRRIQLSEPSVKRILSRGTLTMSGWMRSAARWISGFPRFCGSPVNKWVTHRMF